MIERELADKVLALLDASIKELLTRELQSELGNLTPDIARMVARHFQQDHKYEKVCPCCGRKRR